MDVSKLSVSRRQNVGKHLVCIGTLIACLMCSMAARTQILLNVSGGEQKNVSQFIASGTNTIRIRATAIHDQMLVSAILKGSRTRRIRVLLDYDSPELRTLVGRKNLRIRISKNSKRGKFGGEKLSYSFVLEIGKGYYQEWSGPLIWTKRAFGSDTKIFAGSGDGPGENFVSTSRTFDHDFSAASTIKLPMVKRR